MQPVRIQRSRKEKQTSPNGLKIKYVGRPSKFGNPFRVEQDPDMGFVKRWRVKTSDADCVEMLIRNCDFVYLKKEHAIDDAIKCFSEYVKGINVSELKGQNLSCWCSLKDKCHADVRLELANQPIS